MGFSLQIAPMNTMLDEADMAALTALLPKHGITYTESYQGPEDDFFEVDEDDGVRFVMHPEVGWSWWSEVQKYLSSLIGEQDCPTAHSIHAWRGVAVPGDLEPIVMNPKPMKAANWEVVPTFWERIGLAKKSQVDTVMTNALDKMAQEYSGGDSGLHVVSGFRLLKELEAGLQKAGLEGADPLELYENVDDDDQMAIARCYLAMSHKFLKAGMEGKNLVWWVK